MGIVFDLTCLFFVAAIAYAVASQGLYGAAIAFVNIMLAGLIAFSLYEPAARFVAGLVGTDMMIDFACLALLFAIFFSLIRAATDSLGPFYVRFHGAVDQVGRYLFGLLTGWYLVGMLVCMAQTAPVHKMFHGYQWQTHSFWKMGIDRYWLGYVQATTQKFFEWDPPRPFDPRSDFIMRYHKWRPFGQPDPTMPGFRTAPASTAQPSATGTGGQPGGAATGGAAPGSGGGRPPLDPVGATQQPNL